MAIKFGTDGWRAIIGEEYTYDNVGRVLQAFCDLHSNAKQEGVILGYDRRFCSDKFAEEAAQVLLGNGFKVLLSKNYCPTPCVSWMTKKKKLFAGVMITASHNPYSWNGIKFKEGYGGSASPEWTAKVESQILENDRQKKVLHRLSLLAGKEKHRLHYFDPFQDYLKHLKTMVDLPAIRRAKLKIVVDPIHGAGSGFFPQLLNSQVEEIRGEFNPSFGGVNPEPIEKNLAAAMQAVKQKKAHVALATDGDADRIGAIDEKGNFVNSHQIFSLLLRHLIAVKKWKGDVIKTVSTTQMINRLAHHYGRKVVETPIGFKFICQEFLKTDPLIGGEESGGIGIGRHVYERDGILSGLLLLEIMAYHRKPLSKILQDLQKEVGPLFFQREDFPLPMEKISQAREVLREGVVPNFGKLKVKDRNFRDGFKFLFSDDSWILIRPSGTEPLLRVYAEATSEAQTKQLIRFGKIFVEQL